MTKTLHTKDPSNLLGALVERLRQTTHDQEVTGSIVRVETFVPYAWWIQKDNLLSSSEQRPTIRLIKSLMLDVITIKQTDKQNRLQQKV